MGINSDSKIDEKLQQIHTKIKDISAHLFDLSEKEEILSKLEDINETVGKEINQLQQKNSLSTNTKEINNRMSKFYETENLTLGTIVKYIKIFYWICIIPITMGIFLKFNDMKSVFFSICMIMLPFLFEKIKDKFLNSNNCPTFLPSLGYQSGGSKTCQLQRAEIPMDCVVSDWGKCSKPCGGGFQTRTIEVQPLYGGKKCPSRRARIRKCNLQPCPDSSTGITGESAPELKCTPSALELHAFATSKGYVKSDQVFNIPNIEGVFDNVKDAYKSASSEIKDAMDSNNPYRTW